MGVDPGTHKAGYAVVEASAKGLRVIDCGVVRARKQDLSRRLKDIYDGILEVLALHEPDTVAVEEVFYGKNIQSTVKIGEGRGVVLLAAAVCDVPVAEYSPAEVKKSVVGNGQAHKSQVQRMVQALLGLPEPPEPDDVADALAIAICHSHRMKEAVARA